MDIHELEAESAELLPGREALGKLSFDFIKTTKVANVAASNNSVALNNHSLFSEADSAAGQSISISQ